LRNVLSALARDFTVWMNRMTVFTKFPVKRRLILALLILHEQYRISGSPPGVITITRTELSEYVGASLETVVRVLNTLKVKDLVQINGRRILIKDIEEMVMMMEGEEV
jgi:CRP-like cAMP-binding protein